MKLPIAPPIPKIINDTVMNVGVADALLSKKGRRNV
jgi:hypothetical protein